MDGGSWADITEREDREEREMLLAVDPKTIELLSFDNLSCVARICEIVKGKCCTILFSLRGGVLIKLCVKPRGELWDDLRRDDVMRVRFEPLQGGSGYPLVTISTTKHSRHVPRVTRHHPRQIRDHTHHRGGASLAVTTY